MKRKLMFMHSQYKFGKYRFIEVFTPYALSEKEVYRAIFKLEPNFMLDVP